jgi:glycosyltransferase involved in cell wall biosynthesis
MSVTFPEVSIILTTYNRVGMIGLTIESILCQTYVNFELIICDDCSTDDTQKICETYLSSDRRVKYFRNAKNLKMPENLNNGIRKASGKFIANLHDGDIYRMDLIERWKEALDSNPDAAFVFNDIDDLSAFGSNDYAVGPVKKKKGQVEIAQHFFATLTSCVWGTVMVRKEVYEELGLFNEHYGFISDVEMWLRITQSYQFAYIPEKLIDLAPREVNHPFFFYNWRHKYWEFMIMKLAFSYFEKLLPKEVNYQRKNFRKRLVKNFLRTLLSLVWNRQFKRVKEGLSIFKDSPFYVLRFLGIVFNFNEYPDWYDKDIFWKGLITEE